MKRYHAMWKKTWFAWLAIGGTCAVISAFSTVFLVIFLLNIPIWIGMFIYFSHVRFDDNGEYRKQWSGQ